MHVSKKVGAYSFSSCFPDKGLNLIEMEKKFNNQHEWNWIFLKTFNETFHSSRSSINNLKLHSYMKHYTISYIHFKLFNNSFILFHVWHVWVMCTYTRWFKAKVWYVVVTRMMMNVWLMIWIRGWIPFLYTFHCHLLKFRRKWFELNETDTIVYHFSF